MPEGRYIDSNDPNRCSWDKELEMGLPDSRLRGPRRRNTTVVLGRMLMEKVFCANCGCDGGLVTAEWSPHVFYLCEPCARQPNIARQVCAAAGIMEIPESVARGQGSQQ